MERLVPYLAMHCLKEIAIEQEKQLSVKKIEGLVLEEDDIYF